MLRLEFLVSPQRAWLPLEFIAAAGRPIRAWAAEVFENTERNSVALTWLLTSRDLDVDLSNPLHINMNEERRAVLHSVRRPTWVVIQTLPGEATTRLEELFNERWRAWFGPSAAVPEIKWQKCDQDSKADDQGEWANAIFPETRDELGEQVWSEVLKSYFVESDLMREPPWESLRFLPGILRRRASEKTAELVVFERAIFERAALEWARFQCMISPQDEVHECQSLKSNEVMLNPALQILKLPLRGEVRAIVREQKDSGGLGKWSLKETVLDWMDAAIVDMIEDTIEENFRADARVILKHVELEHSEPSPLRTIGLAAPLGTFTEKLEALVHEGIVLRG